KVRPSALFMSTSLFIALLDSIALLDPCASRKIPFLLPVTELEYISDFGKHLEKMQPVLYHKMVSSGLNKE
ncbi:MAG TPA: hypothetical protein VIP56_12000, partial [Nitrososphaeraceae archaeon]